MSDNKTEGDMSMPSEKRDIKAARKSKCKQGSKYMKRLQVLIESYENVTDVQCEMSMQLKI